MRGDGDNGDLQRATKFALSEEAAAWFVSLRDDALSLQLRQRYVRWLKQSPTHIAELLRVLQIHKLVKAANIKSRPRGPGSQEQDEASNVIELVPRAAEPVQHRVRFESWKVAACAAVLAVSLLFGLVKVAWFDRTIETEAGEWRTVSLSGGSVRVGPDSLLRLSFGGHGPVRFLRGEAIFDSRTAARQGGENVVAVTEGTVGGQR